MKPFSDMAMPAGNAAISDKMQYQSNGAPGGAPGGAAEMLQPSHWVPDERDSFIFWLRSEFAAANAIIDSLCHHLRSVGEPGEYDFAVGAIQQRRHNWSAVLHMQQYFPVAEVVFALQQVAMRKRQPFEYSKNVVRNFKKSGKGYRQLHHHKIDNGKDPVCNGNSSERGEKKEGDVSEDNCSISAEGKEEANGCSPENGESYLRAGISVKEFATIEDGSGSNTDANSGASNNPAQNEKQKLNPVPKIFVGDEIVDGRMVNIVEGLTLYEELIDSAEISKLFLLANELKATGQRGELRGPAYVLSKRPMKGHGREMLQFGCLTADRPSEDINFGGISKDQNVEAIPSMLQEVINHMVQLHIVSEKPESCSIDFYNEGDYSHPFMYPIWYGRPICILCLTECDMVFGKVIGLAQPGVYRGSLKVSLSAGSLLVLQGRSSDFVKHAISSMHKQRILVTFTKCYPKKSAPAAADSFHLPLTFGVPGAPQWQRHHQSGLKHSPVARITGVLSAPTIRPQHHPSSPSSEQLLFVAAPVAPAIPFSGPVPSLPSSGASAWQVVPSQHPAPRPLPPGTGVFLPPSGSGHSPHAQQQATGQIGITMENSSQIESQKCSETLDANAGASNASPKTMTDGKGQNEDCNGKISNQEEQPIVRKEAMQDNSNVLR